MIDLTKINDFNSSDFHTQLQLTPSHLPVELTNKFFAKLFSFFSEDFPELKGVEILNAVIRTIQSPNHLKEFLKGNFNSKLPFSDPVYYPNLLNILNEYAVRSPENFDDYLISQFSKIITYDNFKSLTIIALFIKNSKKENNSSKQMKNLLFTYSNIFMNQGIFQDYVSLLIYMCQTNKSFEKENGQKCWQIICEILISQHRDLYIDAYNALCYLYDIDSSLIFSNEIPYSTISEHIHFADLENSVISLLYRISFSEKAKLDKEDAEFTLTNEQKIKLIDSLVKVSKSNENATLLLCNFAENVDCAKHLVDISREWFSEAIPTYENTIKLFGVILQHYKLRSEITNKSETILLFDHMLKTKVPIIINSISHFVRHMDITDLFIDNLCSEIDFFKRYFTLIRRMKSDTLYISSFLLADVISRQKYISDLDSVCEFICSYVSQNIDQGEDFLNYSKSRKNKNNKIDPVSTAIKVAIILAQHYNCALVFKKMNFHQLLKKELKKQDEQTKKDTRIFLQQMKNTLKRPPHANVFNDLIQEEEEDM